MKSFVKEKGQVAIEYALLFVVVSSLVFTFGDIMKRHFVADCSVNNQGFNCFFQNSLPTSSSGFKNFRLFYSPQD